ncbi:nuclear factor NF-kappa-B p105 subunit [Agrilus planipennis]|uniref:Nuclear factor NF-kappa-B p105 subunit n=1 Tax=Agrilus planipennis TaxID=224129 RepID=A0A7F5RGZ7_AGRPL|nr:nuclear factor NF-kappa-B p105 subunit [Agrilus planipennis]
MAFMNFSETRTRLFNLDENKFEDFAEMNSYPSLLTPPSDSPERSHAFSPPLNAGQNVYAHHQESGMQYETESMKKYYASDTAHLKILEQPIEKFRFRYKSEMAGTHGSLTGRSADRNRKQTFPTVQLCNYSEPAIIRCSVYQEASQTFEECQPHAHRLVKKNGQIEIDDPHDVPVSRNEDFTVGFYGMGIIHTARKQIVEILTNKKLLLKKEEIARSEGKKRDINAEEFLEVKNETEGLIKNINLNIVRLRFDAFTVRDGIYYPICSPVYSKNINNLKSAQTCDLKIVRMDHCTSPCRGNREIFILVEKVTKKNIKIRFFELNEDDEMIWDDYGSFNDLDVHHQFAIVFKTPPYRDLNCDRNVKVYMELVRPSDGARSEPKEFIYTPCDPITGRKRPRTTYGSGSSYNSFASDEIALTIPEDNVVRSEELEEALKYSNISSSEVERLFNTFGPQYRMIDFPNFEDEITNADGKVFLALDAGNSSRKDISDRLVKNKIIVCFANTTRKRTGGEDWDEKLYEVQWGINNSVHSVTKRTPFSIIHTYRNSGLFGNPLTKEIQDINKKLGGSKLLPDVELLLDANKEKQSKQYDKHRRPAHVYKPGDIVLIRSEIPSTGTSRKLSPKYRGPPFHLALYGQSRKLLILFMHLLNENPSPSIINARNHSRDSILHVAVAMGVLPVVNFLVARNANLTLQNEDGNTALHLAVKLLTNSSTRKQTSVAILNLLLVNGNINRFIDLENNAGDSALATAIESKNLDVVKKLCLKGADVNKKHKKNGFTPLHMAIYAQSYGIVDFLLEHKDIELQIFDFKDCTPYKLAANLRDNSNISQKICERIENYMRINAISEMIEVKEELSDDESIKVEPMSPKIDDFEDDYPSDPFSVNCLNEVSKYLDESGNWKNLAELLDMEHFVRIEDIRNYKSPSKSLLNMALANGESLSRIRDFLENLDEKEAVHAIDQMCKRNREHSSM